MSINLSDDRNDKWIQRLRDTNGKQYGALEVALHGLLTAGKRLKSIADLKQKLGKSLKR